MQGSILFSRDAINAHAAAQAFMNYLVDEDNAEVRNKLSRPYRLFQRRLDGDGYDCYLLAENATEFVLDNPQTCGFDDYPAVIQELRTQGCYSATFADLSAGRGMDAQLDQAVLLDVETDPEIYRQIIGRVARGKNNGLVSHLYTMTDLIEQVGDPSNEEEYQLKKWRKQDYTTDRIQQKRNNVGSIKARKIQAGYILNYYCSSLIELLTMIQDFLPPGNEESLNAAANSVKQMAANLNTADWNTAQIAQKVEELWQTFSEVTQQAGLLNSEDGCEYLQLNFDPSNNINKNLAQQTMDGVETYSVINAKLYALHPNTFMCYQQSLSQFSQSTPAALTTYDRRCLLGGEWAVFSELVNKQWCQYNANLAKLVHACNSVMASEDGQALNASLQAIADLLNNPDDSCYTQSLIILSVLSHGSENKRNQRLQTALRKLLAESTEPNSQLELDSNARFAICQALSDDCYQSCSDMLSTSSNRKTQVPPRGVIKDLKQQLVLDGYLDIRTAKQDTIADNLKKRLDVIFNMNNCAINANEDQHSKLRKAYYVKCLELFNEGKLGAVNTTVTVNIDGTVYECSLPAKSDWLLSVTQLQARPYSSNPFKYFFQRCFGLQREPTQAAMNFQQYLRHEAGLDQPSASAQLELKSAQEGESAQLAVT